MSLDLLPVCYWHELLDMVLFYKATHNESTLVWGGSRGGLGGSVEPPKLNVKTYNKRVVKRK